MALAVLSYSLISLMKTSRYGYADNSAQAGRNAYPSHAYRHGSDRESDNAILAGLIRTARLCSLKAECKGLNLTSISRRLVYGVVIEDVGHPLTNPRQTADKGSNAFCTVPLSILQF